MAAVNAADPGPCARQQARGVEEGCGAVRGARRGGGGGRREGGVGGGGGRGAVWAGVARGRGHLGMHWSP